MKSALEEGIHSFTHSFIYSFIHSFFHSISFSKQLWTYFMPGSSLTPAKICHVCHRPGKQLVLNKCCCLYVCVHVYNVCMYVWVDMFMYRHMCPRTCTWKPEEAQPSSAVPCFTLRNQDATLHNEKDAPRAPREVKKVEPGKPAHQASCSDHENSFPYVPGMKRNGLETRDSASTPKSTKSSFSQP